MLASFQESGTVPDVNDLVKMLLRIGAKLSEHLFRIRGCSPSGPVDLHSFNLEINFKTLWVEKMSKSILPR